MLYDAANEVIYESVTQSHRELAVAHQTLNSNTYLSNTYLRSELSCWGCVSWRRPLLLWCFCTAGVVPGWIGGIHLLRSFFLWRKLSKTLLNAIGKLGCLTPISNVQKVASLDCPPCYWTISCQLGILKRLVVCSDVNIALPQHNAHSIQIKVFSPGLQFYLPQKELNTTNHKCRWCQ